MNTHCMFGLMGFAVCVACRSCLTVQGGVLGQSVMNISLVGALLLIISSVNRVVVTGASDGVHRYGPNCLYLSSFFFAWFPAYGQEGHWYLGDRCHAHNGVQRRYRNSRHVSEEWLNGWCGGDLLLDLTTGILSV